MRLIKESEVISCVDKNTNNDNSLNNDISCILEEVPTAYNVDKVIKQLEEKAECAEQKAVEHGEKCEAAIMHIWNMRAKIYRDAIEIVKSGGVANGEH